MRYLNLDPAYGLDYEPIEFEAFTFPGGEQHIKLVPFDIVPDQVRITHRIRTSADLMLILMAVDALRQQGVEHIELEIPYLPYARQDRVCNPGEAFTLKVFANLINSCDFKYVYILDAHSDVGPALINNCVNQDNSHFILESMEQYIDTYDVEDINIVAPDAGAVKKIYKLVQLLTNAYPNINFRLTTCDKVRNLSTGEIIRTEVYADHVLSHCVVIDDIVDGGRTMIEVTKALKDKGADHVTMMVAHGIFSKGYGVFGETINRIYTTNSFKDHFTILIEDHKYGSEPAQLVRKQHIRDDGYPAAWFVTVPT